MPCRHAVSRPQHHAGATRHCQALLLVWRARWGLLDRNPGRPHNTRQRHVRSVCVAPPGATRWHGHPAVQMQCKSCCRSDIVAVVPRLEFAAVDVMVAHASAKSYAAHAAKTAGWTATSAEQTKRTRFRKDVLDHATFRFVPFAVEACGYMGKDAVHFVNRLGDITVESGPILKGALVRWAMQLLSMTVLWGNAQMYRRSGLIISLKQGLRYDVGCAVPMLMS